MEASFDDEEKKLMFFSLQWNEKIKGLVKVNILSNDVTLEHEKGWRLGPCHLVSFIFSPW